LALNLEKLKLVNRLRHIIEQLTESATTSFNAEICRLILIQMLRLFALAHFAIAGLLTKPASWAQL
jgi:hypothetical protein